MPVFLEQLLNVIDLIDWQKTAKTSYMTQFLKKKKVGINFDTLDIFQAKQALIKKILL